MEWSQLGAGPRSVRHGQDQSHGHTGSLGKGLTLELAGAQLPLKIHKRPLDLDLNHFIRPREKDVRCPTISRSNRSIQACRPAAVRYRQDCLGRRELPRVTEGHAIDWVEAQTQLVPHGSGDAAADAHERPVSLVRLG
jgi:hypothetical protein